MIVWSVRYGDGQTVMLRDPRYARGYLRGIECNELGVAARNGCQDAEFRIREDLVVSTEIVEREEAG